MPGCSVLIKYSGMYIFYHCMFCRRIHSNPAVPQWIRADPDHAGHQQEILSALLSESGASGRRRAEILQTTGLYLTECMGDGLGRAHGIS